MESEATQWKQIYRRLKSEGKPCAPRGLKILEVENFSYSLAPYVRFPNFEARHLNLEYVREEFQWYLGGDPYRPAPHRQFKLLGLKFHRRDTKRTHLPRRAS